MDKSIYSESLAEDRDNFIDNLFNKTDDVTLDDVDDVLETPGLVINLDEVNNAALSRSTDIIEHLSVEINKRKYDLWFDEEGKFKRNAPLYPLSYNGKIYDVIMGNIVVTKSRNGKTEGIPDKEWDSLKKALEEKAYEALRAVSKMIK